MRTEAPLLASSRGRTSKATSKLLGVIALAIVQHAGCAGTGLLERGFGHSDLVDRRSRVLVVRLPTPPELCVAATPVMAELHLRLDLGSDYDYGNNAFVTSVRVRVRGYEGTPGDFTSPMRLDEVVALNLEESAPEQLHVIDLLAGVGRINWVNLEIEDYTPDARVQSAIRLEPAVVAQYALGALDTAAPILPLVFPSNVGMSENRAVFQWRKECAALQNYEFQLLRLHNHDPAKVTETEVTARVDWRRAFTIETGSPSTSLALTIAEGTGYYAWRVRPIGNSAPGGIANDANWGVWSPAPQSGDIIELSATRTPPPFAFFYRQFDDDRNWIYSRVVTETHKVADRISYADGLGHPRQHQQSLLSDGAVVARQLVYDYSGRAALESLPAPIARDDLGYVERILEDGPGLYTAASFDSDATLREPRPITSGPVADYYSDSNPDLGVPSAGGYPFKRTLFYGGGSDRISELSRPGAAFRLRPEFDAGRTRRIYYTGVSDQEVVRLFGDEAPRAMQVHKAIQVDSNKTPTVSYIETTGKLLATALAVTPSNTESLDVLPSREGAITSVVDLVEGDVSCGEGCIEAHKQLAFAQPTELYLDYEIDPNPVTESCTDTCESCDYRVEFWIHRLDDPADPEFPKRDQLDVPASACGGEPLTWSSHYSLPPGSYRVTKRIRGDTEPPSGPRPLEAREANLVESLREDAESALAPILEHLEADDLESAFAALGVPPDTDSGEVPLTAGCCDLSVPFERCEVGFDRGHDFEGHFEAFWAGTTAYTGLTGGRLNYLPDFRPGEFNELIVNMMNDPTAPYDLDALWRCWDAAVRSYGPLEESARVLNSDADPNNDVELDLLGQFLNCAEYRLRGFVSRAIGPSFEEPGYLSHAYAYFRYAEGDSPRCEAVFSPDPGAGAPPNWAAFRADDWRHFSLCVDNTPPGAVVEADILARKDSVEDACRSVCGARYPGFVDSLIRLYEERGMSVPRSVSVQQLHCQAQRLVDRCEAGCTLSVLRDSEDPSLVIGVGTPEEIQSMTESMTYAYQLTWPLSTPSPGVPGPPDTVAGRPVGSGALVCPTGFEPLREPVAYDEALLSFLNYELESFRSDLFEDSSTTTGNFPFRAAMEEFGSPNDLIADGRSFDAICSEEEVPVSEDRDPAFSRAEESCQLLYVDDVDSPSAIGRTACDSICLGSTRCGGICFRWIPSVVTVPPRRFVQTSCEAQASRAIEVELDRQLDECRASRVAALQFEYESSCLRAETIRDRFSLSYELGYHHFTLYYYDRAGNLVRTVPPEGVDLSSTSRADHPQHRYVTEYDYNSVGAQTRRSSPDSGETIYVYRPSGDLRFVQDERQRDEGNYTYQKYDPLGRLVESGQSRQDSATFEDHVVDAAFPDRRADATEVVNYVYSTPAGSGRPQRFTRDRLSMTSTDEGVLTRYSYDPHGNVEWMAQDIPGLGEKYIDYKYDLVSGRVLERRYSVGEPDQFLQRLSYDANGRLLQVESSDDDRLWDRDARYDYYRHGPTRRFLVGEDAVQGVDYVYTLEGWPKGINHPSLDRTKDPGSDGLGNNRGRDFFGLVLGYYQDDFTRSGSPFNALDPLSLNPTGSLFDGRITSSVFSRALVSPMFGSQYRYDESGRLTSSLSFYHTATWESTEDYASSYGYDGNGNIRQLTRNGRRTPALAMDDLTFEYESTSSNRLTQIVDSVAADAYGDDIDSQSAGNYSYDAVGNLTSDRQARISAIQWSSRGRAKRVSLADGTTAERLYDAYQNLVRDSSTYPDGSRTSIHFVRDSDGLLLAVYEEQIDGDGVSSTRFSQPIYGLERLGLHQPASSGSSLAGPLFTRELGGKLYELTDQVGSVRAVVSDVKLSSLDAATGSPEGFRADVLAAFDYYPFGSPLPFRSDPTTDYVFGFQGMEKDFAGGTSPSRYRTLHRRLNTAAARWESVDPAAERHPGRSPYAALGNDPLRLRDPRGDDEDAWERTVRGHLTEASLGEGRFTGQTMLEFWIQEESGGALRQHRIRADFLVLAGTDQNPFFLVIEAKGTATAPLTDNQRMVFAELQRVMERGGSIDAWVVADSSAPARRAAGVGLVPGDRLRIGGVQIADPTNVRSVIRTVSRAVSHPQSRWRERALDSLRNAVRVRGLRLPRRYGEYIRRVARSPAGQRAQRAVPFIGIIPAIDQFGEAVDRGEWLDAAVIGVGMGVDVIDIFDAVLGRGRASAVPCEMQGGCGQPYIGELR